jgi:hypothetical protein
MSRKERFRNTGAGKGVKEQLDPLTLRRLYVDEGRTQAAIGRTYHCSAQYISQLLREYGISRERYDRLG